MRRLLVDRARPKSADKPGNTPPHVNLDDAPEIASGTKSQSLAKVDDVLQTLEHVNPRNARVVELMFFGGLNVEETAEVLQVSPKTVMRDRKLARTLADDETQSLSLERDVALHELVLRVHHAAQPDSCVSDSKLSRVAQVPPHWLTTGQPCAIR